MSRIANMRVVFLQTNAINESLGLCDLAGHLRALGVRCRLLLEREEGRHLERKLREFAPDLVVVPCDLLGHQGALRLTRRAAASTEAPVLLGGTHPTFFPNVVQREGVSYAFAGEAEGPVADVLNAIRHGLAPEEIDNLILRDGEQIRQNPLRPLNQDLDSLALPDRELYYRYPFIAALPWKKFSTGRGCKNACSYCFNPSYRRMCDARRPFFRRKSPARIVQEIDRVRRRHPLEIVHFSDDLFSSGTDWLAGFVDRYRQDVALPFSCNLFASSVDAQTVELLREAGCRVVAMGIEVADDGLRNKVLNKPVSGAEIDRAAGLLRRAGIRVVSFNILGLPWSDLEGDIDTLVLNQRLRTDHARISIIVPFPRSQLSHRLIRDGFLRPDFDDQIYEVEDLPRWPAKELFGRPDATRVERLYRIWHLATALRLPGSIIRRLVESRWSNLLAVPSTLVALANEQRIFALPWGAGLSYFWHVRSPACKTTNYVSFI